MTFSRAHNRETVPLSHICCGSCLELRSLSCCAKVGLRDGSLKYRPCLLSSDSPRPVLMTFRVLALHKNESIRLMFRKRWQKCPQTVRSAGSFPEQRMIIEPRFRAAPEKDHWSLLRCLYPTNPMTDSHQRLLGAILAQCARMSYVLKY